MSKKQYQKLRVRNPYVAMALFRKSGAHQKTKGAVRVQQKREVQRLVQETLETSHELNE